LQNICALRVSLISARALLESWAGAHESSKYMRVYKNHCRSLDASGEKAGEAVEKVHVPLIRFSGVGVPTCVARKDLPHVCEVSLNVLAGSCVREFLFEIPLVAKWLIISCACQSFASTDAFGKPRTLNVLAIRRIFRLSGNARLYQEFRAATLLSPSRRRCLPRARGRLILGSVASDWTSREGNFMPAERFLEPVEVIRRLQAKNGTVVRRP